MKLKKIRLKAITIFFLSLIFVFQLSSVGVAVSKEIETHSEGSEKLYSQAITETNQNAEAITNGNNFFIFGYGADATPISSQQGEGTAKIDEATFCGQIYKKFEEERKHGYLKGYVIKLVELDSSQRFKGLIEHRNLSEITRQSGIEFNEKMKDPEKDNLKQRFFEKNLGVECGPNSITKERESDLEKVSGVFLKKFYTTGAKILIHKDNRHLLYQPSFFAENQKTSNGIPRVIGVVGGERKNGEAVSGCLVDNPQDARDNGTTTGTAVKAIYGAQVKVLVLRSQAKDCLIDKSIIAYSSDEILLRGMLKEYASDLKDYVIEPSIAPLTYEAYGVVAYGRSELRDALIQRIERWSDKLNEEKYFEAKEKELPRYNAQEKSSLVSILWLPVESFYRSGFPLFLLKSNLLTLIILSIFIALFSLLLLTHRWIATPIARLFPCLFRLPIEFIERLRKRGFADDNKVLQLLSEVLRGPEQILRETYNKSQGITKSEIDSYDVVQVLEVQVKFAKQFRPDSQMQIKEEDVANDIAEQIKTDPHAREVVNELTKSLSTSWGNQVGEQLGKESADQFMSLLRRIAEQVYRSDS
jgi:hypothetical protein